MVIPRTRSSWGEGGQPTLHLHSSAVSSMISVSSCLIVVLLMLAEPSAARRTVADHFRIHAEARRAAQIDSSEPSTTSTLALLFDDAEATEFANEPPWSELLLQYTQLVHESRAEWSREWTQRRNTSQILRISGLLRRATGTLPQCCLLPTFSADSRRRYETCMSIMRRGVYDAWVKQRVSALSCTVAGQPPVSHHLASIVATAERCASLGIWDSIIINIINRENSSVVKSCSDHARANDPADCESSRVDFYTLLGVAPDGTHAAVKRAYLRARAGITHYGDDENTNDVNENDVAQELMQEAFEVLYDPWRRQKYDEHRELQRDRVRRGVTMNDHDAHDAAFTPIDLWVAARASYTQYRWLLQQAHCERNTTAREEATRVLQRYLHYEFLIESPASTSRALTQYLKYFSLFFSPANEAAHSYSHSSRPIETAHADVHPSWLARQLLVSPSAWSPFDGFWVEGSPRLFDLSSIAPLRSWIVQKSRAKMTLVVDGRSSERTHQYTEAQLTALKRLVTTRDEPSLVDVRRVFFEGNSAASEREIAYYNLIGAKKPTVARNSQFILLCSLHRLTELVWSDTLQVLGLSYHSLAMEPPNSASVLPQQQDDPLNLTAWEELMAWSSLFARARHMMQSMRCKASSELPLLMPPGKSQRMFSRGIEMFEALVASDTVHEASDRRDEFFVGVDPLFEELNVALMMGFIFQERAINVVFGVHGDVVRRNYRTMRSLTGEQLLEQVFAKRDDSAQDDGGMPENYVEAPFAKHHRRAALRCITHRGFLESTIHPHVLEKLAAVCEKRDAAQQRRDIYGRGGGPGSDDGPHGPPPKKNIREPVEEFELLLRNQDEDTRVYQLYRFYSIFFFSIAHRIVNTAVAKGFDDVCDSHTLFCVDDSMYVPTGEDRGCCLRTAQLLERKVKSFMHIEGIAPDSTEETEWLSVLLTLSETACNSNVQRRMKKQT